MPDFLCTVFTSENLYNFNVLKLIQRPTATFLYFIPLRTHRQSLGTFSGPGNLWKIILCPGSCERCVAQSVEGWSWSLALADLLVPAHTVNCMASKEKNDPYIS